MRKWLPPKKARPPKRRKKATRVRRTPRPTKKRRNRNPYYRIDVETAYGTSVVDPDDGTVAAKENGF